MSKKYLYALLVCLTISLAIVPQFLRANASTCSYNPEAYQNLDLGSLTQELETTGLIGRIHGAANPSQMYVLSVREPNNFFAHQEFSLISSDRKTQETFSQLNRHDLLCIQGNILPNPSPQQHIAVTSATVLQPWQQPAGYEPYERSQEIPEQLKQQDNFVGKVHAIGEAGKILVVEYQDGVIPLYVRDTQYTKDLYRGDIVRLYYQIQTRPQEPTHLLLDTAVDQPVEVLDAIASWHEQTKTLQGNLVKFPRSPQLKFDVYAMAVTTQGIQRYFTLINFQDMNKFQNIRTKLADLWDANQATSVAGRNMLINPEVQIEATGIINLVSTEQANPQILLESADSVNIANEPQQEIKVSRQMEPIAEK